MLSRLWLKPSKNNDEQALLDVLGHEHKQLISDDKQAARETRKIFYEAAQQLTRLEDRGRRQTHTGGW